MKENILQKVRKIEIKTRGLSNDIFAGKYHSAFKGRGMAFSEVRDYRIGDDIRDIDWNVTARSREPHIKVFQEERELTLMLLVDVSGSEDFGTRERLKRTLATELAAVMAFSAAQNNDKIGCVIFSDKIERYIPAKKGRQHVLRIISELLEFKPQSKGTDVGLALKFFANVVKKRCTAFLISDLIDMEPGGEKTRFEDALKITALKHDLVSLRIYDQRERELLDVGIIEALDSETGQQQWIDTSSAALRKRWAENWELSTQTITSLLSRNSVDNVLIATDQDYVKALIKLFKMR